MTENPITSLDIVKRIFSNWTALRMAVEHGNGTIDAANGFCEYVAETLALNERLHYTDISGELEDYMDEIFNTRLEDDSEKQVAQDVVRFHNYIIANDMVALTSELQRLPPLQPWIIPNQNFPRATRLDDNNDSDDDDDDDDGDDADENDQNGEAGNSEGKSNGSMEVDSEGWSVIRRKKK